MSGFRDVDVVESQDDTSVSRGEAKATHQDGKLRLAPVIAGEPDDERRKEDRQKAEDRPTAIDQYNQPDVAGNNGQRSSEQKDDFQDFESSWDRSYSPWSMAKFRR